MEQILFNHDTIIKPLSEYLLFFQQQLKADCHSLDYIPIPKWYIYIYVEEVWIEL